MIADRGDYEYYVEEVLKETLPHCENVNYKLDLASDYFKSIYNDCCSCSCTSSCNCDTDDENYPEWAKECICKGVYYWSMVESEESDTSSETKMQEVIYRCAKNNCGIRVDC